MSNDTRCTKFAEVKDQMVDLRTLQPPRWCQSNSNNQEECHRSYVSGNLPNSFALCFYDPAFPDPAKRCRSTGTPYYMCDDPDATGDSTTAKPTVQWITNSESGINEAEALGLPGGVTNPGPWG